MSASLSWQCGEGPCGSIKPEEGTALCADLEHTLEQSWEVEESLVEVNGDCTTTLILRNPTDITIHLEEGDVIGELQHAEEVARGAPEELSAVMGQVIEEKGGQEWRTGELWKTLDVEKSSQSNVELAQLRQVVEDYSDVCAV